MKTFVNPVTTDSHYDDPEGELWINCIRVAQVFLVLLSFTVIHHITNPFDLKEDVLTAVTAALSAAECAFLVILCTLLCITKRDTKVAEVKKYSASSLHPSEYSIHPVYFI